MYLEEIIETLTVDSGLEALEGSVTQSVISSLSESFNQSLQNVTNSLLSMIGSIIPIVLVILGAVLVISIGIAIFKYFINDNSVVTAAVSPAYDFLEENFDDIVESYQSEDFDNDVFLEIFQE